MEDAEENAAIVNALQRHSAVVVQKSLAEGFGLTVAEAMWKGRPVVASAVGGIRDQIDDGVSGVLLTDPLDQTAFGAAVRGLLADPRRAAAMGSAARARVRDRFLSIRHLTQYELLFEALGRPAVTSGPGSVRAERAKRPLAAGPGGAS
jgi:trehalose synthase